MIVLISDLVLWQWRPSMVLKCCWDSASRYKWEDELLIRDIMCTIRKKGINRLTPIRINRYGEGPMEDDGWFSKKAKKQALSGKWVVWDGFHRIYAARRLGYKMIRASVY